jgi:hypothetical protein
MNVCSFKPGLVTLIDGTQVRSDSEAWRAECEARGVLEMRTKDARRMFLFKVEKRRGYDARNKLEADIYRVFNHYRGLEQETENSFRLRA